MEIKHSTSKNIGTLYIVATPIGNLEDITLRALRILKEVDIIAAEDTRHTLKLLNHYEIKKHLISYHSNSVSSKGELILNRLLIGNNIALVSDSGTPLISDPGYPLVDLCISNNITVSIIPGPCAAIAGLVLSGLDTSRFAFEGFLPLNRKKKLDRIEMLKDETRTMIFYEAPHKLVKTLEDIFKILGERKISITRELTKKYEEIKHSSLSNAITNYSQSPPKGEFVLILEGQKNTIKNVDFSNVEQLFYSYTSKGFSKSEAIKQISNIKGVNKREIYSIVNSL